MSSQRLFELDSAVAVDILPKSRGDEAITASNSVTLGRHIDRFGALDVILTPLGDRGCSSIGVFVTASVHAAVIESEQLDQTTPAAM